MPTFCILGVRQPRAPKPATTALLINPPGNGPVQAVLNTPELLSNILCNVGFPENLTSKDSVSAFITLSKCLRVCKKWNMTIQGYRKLNQRTFRDHKLIESSDKKVLVCQPFVTEIMRWSELSQYRAMGPLKFLKVINFPCHLFFTQPPVQAVSFSFSMIYGNRTNWVPALQGGTNQEYTEWDADTETLKYFCQGGVKVGGIAKVLQDVEEYFIKGMMIGVTIGVVGGGKGSDGLPVWIDYDGDGMDEIREGTGDMPEEIFRVLRRRGSGRRLLTA
ncbi:hypothetical protein TWF506_004661 [Arthrobotrys conoides]|uniref:Uncharacterized protein n=1 Tax=Arthrobotrys conoides TaxID=74498 RepID=A0AAN8NB21_9PEZI